MQLVVWFLKEPFPRSFPTNKIYFENTKCRNRQHEFKFSASLDTTLTCLPTRSKAIVGTYFFEKARYSVSYKSKLVLWYSKVHSLFVTRVWNIALVLRLCVC